MQTLPESAPAQQHAECKTAECKTEAAAPGLSLRRLPQAWQKS